MVEAVQTQPPAVPSQSPLHQPARDNAGNITPALEAHTQRPDAPAARAGAIADGAYDNLPPDQQNKYARVPNGDQGGQWVERSTLPSATERPAADAPANPAETLAPGERVKVGDMEVTAEELREFFQAKGDAELKKASLPATPEAYEAKLPDGFTTPEGIEFKIDDTAPLLADARRWAHAKGLGQGEFSELMSLYAADKAREASQYNAAHAAEVAKMGANGTMRVTALEMWLRGVVGDKLAGPMRTMMVTADIVKGLETLQAKFSSQGVAPMSVGGREPSSNGKVTDEQWAGMSDAARLSYAQSHDQSQFQKR